VTFASFCSKLVPAGQGKHCAGGPAGFDEQRINGVNFMLEQKSTKETKKTGVKPLSMQFDHDVGLRQKKFARRDQT
jgi:hypothetical protein